MSDAPNHLDARATSSGAYEADVVALRKDFEDDYVAMERVLELLGRVTEKDTVDDICRTIVEGVRELLGFDRSGLFLWDAVDSCFHGTFGTDVDGKTTDEHDLYWAADGWGSTRQIQAGAIFIDEVLDQPPPRPGEENLKAYMVVLRFGEKVHGILSVDNRITQRRIMPRELQYLTLFSRIVGNAVDISKYRMQLERNNEQFRRELRLAQSIQLGFLPKTFPMPDRIVFAHSYNTCDMLGGDLFDVLDLGPDHVGVYVADVAGHGVSAALLCGALKMAVASLRGRGPSALLQPDSVLRTLNTMFVQEIPEDEFITMLYVVFNVKRRVFRAASAGHLPPIHFHAASGEAAAWTIRTGPPLGTFPDSEYPLAEVEAASGDRVLLFTDGLTEAMNAEGEEFGEERVQRLVREHGRESASAIRDVLRHAFAGHGAKAALGDDWTLLAAEIR